MMKKVFWTILCMLVAGGALAGALLLRSHVPDNVTPTANDHIAKRLAGWVDINPTTRVSVDIADTEATREQGLSDRKELADGYGMLFLFDTPGKYAFWMKDMLFPLDIIWISSDWHVVDMTANLSPDTYPSSFSPKQDIQYVLEVPAGFAATHQVAIGQLLSFQK